MKQKELAHERSEVYTLLGRSRRFPNMTYATSGQRGHIERAAINAPVQVTAVYRNSLLLFKTSFVSEMIFKYHRAVQQMLLCVPCLRSKGMPALRSLVGGSCCRFVFSSFS